MIFTPTKLEGVWLIEPELLSDERGFFARTWCCREFEQRGLNPGLVQCNTSFNRRAGTVRGFHFQAEPHAESKLVRCTAGAILDVLVDMRPESPSFLKHVSIPLDAVTRSAVYIPEGCAHGFQTLQDSTEVLYQMSVPFHAESSRGVRWNDPALRITWPLPITVISEKDLSFPDLDVAGDKR